MGQTRPSPFYAPTSASANFGHRAALAVGSFVPIVLQKSKIAR
jgi:hypothetical protein